MAGGPDRADEGSVVGWLRIFRSRMCHVLNSALVLLALATAHKLELKCRTREVGQPE